jgi:hypothetical protein
MEVKVYKNNRNPNKYIITKRDNSRHYSWHQVLVFPNGVENPVGSPGFARQSKKTIEEVVNDDYKELKVVWNVVGDTVVEGETKGVLVNACSTTYECAKATLRDLKSAKSELIKGIKRLRVDWIENSECWWF